MSLSGTTSWSLQRDAIISAALRKLAVLSGGSSPESYQVTNAAETLNGMIKSFQVDGMPVWKMNTYSFNTVANTPTYTIGTGQTLNTTAPLKIVQAWRNQTLTSTGAVISSNVPMNVYTNYNFNLLPASANSGPPVNLYYQPKAQTGVISLWPTPALDTTVTTTVYIRYQDVFQDFNAATDDLDFPPYWTEAIIYGLAWRLAPEYGIPTQDRTDLKNEALYFKNEALSFGAEEGSLFIQPDWSGNRR